MNLVIKAFLLSITRINNFIIIEKIILTKLK